MPAYVYVPKRKPSDKTPLPAILLQYGAGGNKKTDYIVAIGKQFASRGFLVITIDSAGCGERRGKDKGNDALGLMSSERVMHFCGDYSRAVDYPLLPPRGGQGSRRLRRHQLGRHHRHHLLRLRSAHQSRRVHGRRRQLPRPLYAQVHRKSHAAKAPNQATRLSTSPASLPVRSCSSTPPRTRSSSAYGPNRCTRPLATAQKSFGLKPITCSTASTAPRSAPMSSISWTKSSPNGRRKNDRRDSARGA